MSQSRNFQHIFTYCKGAKIWENKLNMFLQCFTAHFGLKSSSGSLRNDGTKLCIWLKIVKEEQTRIVL